MDAARHYGNIRLISRERKSVDDLEQLGWIFARGQLLEATDSDWLFWIDADDVQEVRSNIRQIRPDAVVVDAAWPSSVEDPKVIAGKRVLVVEDGPTLTHGEMTY